jgi:hypothetical protein
MAADPGLGPAELREAYLARLAPRTVSGSCIHHTRAGCSLPRGLRSDICNNYACSALVTLLDSQDAGPVREVIVLRRRQNRWKQGDLALDNGIVGAAVLTETRTLRFTLPEPAGEQEP